jgi:hypothetical protein
MDLFTDRPASPAEDFTHEETRNVSLPGTRGADGQPLVLTIRRLPNVMVYTLADEPAEGTVSNAERFQARLELYRKWAEAAVVAPSLSFNGGGPPRWDDLPVAAQNAVATAIAAFTTEGIATQAAAGAAFRGGVAAGGEAGPAGGGPGGHRPDAPGEPPAPAAGVEASPARRPRGRPRRAGGGA